MTPRWFSEVPLQGADNPLSAGTSGIDTRVNIYQRYYEPPELPIGYVRGNNVNFWLIDLPQPASLALLAMAGSGLAWSCRRHEFHLFGEFIRYVYYFNYSEGLLRPQTSA